VISTGVDAAERGRPPPGCFRCVGTEVARVAVLARVDDIEAARLASGLDDAFSLVAGRFFRREVRLRARACVAGMLSGLERRNGWSLAEHTAEPTPDGMQRLFTSAKWDEGLVRDDLRGYVTAALGDLDAVLITEALDHVSADVIADPVYVPVRPPQQPLHPVRAGLACLFGERPPVLPLQARDQPGYVPADPGPRLGPGKPARNPLMQPIQLTVNQFQHHAQHDAANRISAVAVLSVRPAVR
jgi:hypothetical protein